MSTEEKKSGLEGLLLEMEKDLKNNEVENAESIELLEGINKRILYFENTDGIKVMFQAVFRLLNVMNLGVYRYSAFLELIRKELDKKDFIEEVGKPKLKEWYMVFLSEFIRVFLSCEKEKLMALERHCIRLCGMGMIYLEQMQNY